MRPGFTLPIVDFLADLPVTATNGSCFAIDRRGPQANGKIYVLVPTSGSTATFGYLDPNAKTFTYLTAPAQDANSLFGVGTSMCFDESTQGVLLFNPQGTANPPNQDWAQFQRYDVAAGTWANYDTATLNLAAAWGSTGGDSALLHPDARIAVGLPIGGQTQDDGYYLIGNNAVTLYRFNLTGGTNWTTLAPGVARGAAPGAGANLMWNAWDTDKLVSFRGGGSNLVDVYNIQANTWAAGVVTAPAINVTTGFESMSTSGEGHVSYINYGGQVYAYNHRLNTLIDMAHIDGADGAAHTGRGLVYYRLGGRLYFAVRPHSGTAVQRIRAIE